jgi:hypothetical protein
MADFHSIRRFLRAALFSPLRFAAWLFVLLPIQPVLALRALRLLSLVLWTVDGFIFRRGGRS